MAEPILIEPVPQPEMYRRLALPAVQGPIPHESRSGIELAIVAAYAGPHVGALLFPREAAAEFVVAERERIDRAGEAAQLVEWEQCRRDRLWFISRWVDIESKFPLGGQRTVPFTPFLYQARIIRLYDQARAQKLGIFEDKSRQLGLSWLWMALFLHGLLFDEQASFYATSHKEDEVDDGGARSTTDSLFGKVRFMYRALPEFLRASLAGEALTFKHLQVQHATSGTYLSGEAATTDIGRGSSYVVGLLDEFAHIERSESAWASAESAIEVPILSSTPQGEDNKFADLHRKLARPKNDLEREVRRRFLVCRSHWSEHPVFARGVEHDEQGRLTSPWYRRAASTKTPEKVAQEHDIEYAGSLPGRFFPEFSRGVHVPERPIELNRNLFLYLSADHGLADTEVWGLWQTDGETFAELLDEWHSVPEGQRHGADLTSAEVAAAVMDWLAQWNISLLLLEGVIPDPAGGQREQTTGQSHHDLLFAVWSQRGHRLRPEQWIPANNEQAEGVESARMLLRGYWNGRPFRLRVSPRCTLTIDSLVNYRRRITRDGLVLDDELRDWSNHAADMFRYFCHTLFPAIGDVATAAREPEPYTSSVRGRI